MAAGSLGALVLLEVLLNVTLNVGGVQAILHRATDRTQLTWRRAWWLWPVGRLHLRDFTLTQRDANATWKVEVESLEAGVSLTGLLFHRVDVRGIEGRGARFQWEPVPFPEKTPSEPGKNPWVAHLEDATVREVRELDFSRVRYVGSLDVMGSMHLASFDRLQVDLPSVRGGEGFVELDAKRVARMETLSARASLDAPYRAGASWDLSQALSGQVAARFDLLPLDWLNEYLGSGSPVAFRGGGGRVDLDVRMREGVWEAGSRLEARGSELDLRAGPVRARAPWTLDAAMDASRPGEPDGRLRLAFAPVKVSGGEGEGVELPEVALSVLARRRPGQRTLDLEPELQMARSRPLDLRMLNPWLRQTLEIDSGHVTVRSGEPSNDAKERNALHLRMNTDLVSGRMGSNKVLLRADVDVDARRLSSDLTELVLGGATLRLSQVSSNGPAPIRAWSGTFSVPRASLSLSPTVLSARFTSEFTDTQPLVALLAISKNVPPFLASLLNIPKVEVSGQVRIDEKGLQLRELRAKGDGFSMEGFLDLANGEMTGALLTTLGMVTGAVELRPGHHDLHLAKARDWFERQKAPPLR